jgi:hypothetical protein
VQIIEVSELAVRSAVILLRRRGTPMRYVFYPMVHVAQPSFYAEVSRRLKEVDVIVEEGVHGPPSVLTSALTLSYRVARFNRRAGLVEQDLDLDGLDAVVVRPDISTVEFAAGWRRVPLKHRLMVALVLPLVIVTRLLGGSRAIWSRVTDVEDLPSPSEEAASERLPELDAAFGGERDVALLAALSRLHEERSTEDIEVAVVYGAGHVAAVVHALNDRYGYKARSAEWITVVNL